jgi:hypothetical protein
LRLFHCSVDHNFLLGTHLGHRPILVGTPCPGMLQRQLHQVPKSPSPPRTVRAATLSETQQSKFHLVIETTLQPRGSDLISSLDALTRDTPKFMTHTVLGRVSDELTEQLRTVPFKPMLFL